VATFRTDFGDLTLQYGGKTLSHVKSTSTARRALSWDDPGSATDVEILALLSITRPTTERFHVIMRGGGSGGTETGLAVGINYGIGLQFSQYSSGTLTNFSSSFTIVAGQRMWVRARANGSNLRARLWMPGDAEPSTWDIDETTTVTGSGWLGLFAFDFTGQPKYCDYFACDIAGGTAPGIGTTPGANQYSTDFSTQSLGTPADWTAQWTTTASTWEIVDSVRNVLPEEMRAQWNQQVKVFTVNLDNAYSGGAFFAGSYGTQSLRQLFQFHEQPAFENGNVYAVVQSPDTQTATNTALQGLVRAGIGLRTGGTNNSRNGYFLVQLHHPVTGQTRRWALQRYSATPSSGTPTLLWTSAADQWISEEFYEIRLEAVGSTIRGRYWVLGDYEPDTWDFQVTDTSLTSGKAGLIGGYSASTTPTTAVYNRWDEFEFTEYPVVPAELNAAFSGLTAALEGEVYAPIVGELSASFSPLTADLTAEVAFGVDAQLSASFSPLTSTLIGEVVPGFEYDGALAFGSDPDDILEVPVLSVTESGRTAPQPRRRFSGKVSTDMMTIGANPDDRRPRLWDVQTGYMTHDLAADVLHQLTAGGYFYVSGYIIGALRQVSASEINYQEGDMPDLVQLQFILRTR